MDRQRSCYAEKSSDASSTDCLGSWASDTEDGSEADDRALRGDGSRQPQSSEDNDCAKEVGAPPSSRQVESKPKEVPLPHVCGCGKWLEINGAVYPPFWREEAIEQLQKQWAPKSGDVFVVSHFPIRGLQRLLVSLVEGYTNPWEVGRVDKPHFADAAASKRGPERFMEEVESWSCRRFFKTKAFPSKFPSRFLFDEQADTKYPPKIVVLVADPRHALTVWWQFLQATGPGTMKELELAELVRLVASGEFKLFGNYFEHALAWTHEAELHPQSVRLFDAGRLGSLDPKEVKAELDKIAEFLSIPLDGVQELVASTFRRPTDADIALQADQCVMREALNGGHLVEQSGRNLLLFEESVNSAAHEVKTLWWGTLQDWVDCPDPFLAHLAKTSLRGVSSTPILSMTVLLKGEAAHRQGTCRPCVFHLRGICKHGPDMCTYCHEPGHQKTKRASQRVRRMRKRRTQFDRTPSPAPLPRLSVGFGDIDLPGFQLLAS